MSYYKAARGWQDSEFFGDAVFSERDAWIWMIGEAEWVDTAKNVNGKPVPLKRGQFTSSIRFMAEKFQWSKDRVLRFIRRAEKWGMIESKTETGQTIITICNYEKYQGGKDAPKDTVKDTIEDTPKDKLEERKNIRKKEIIARPADVPEQLWEDHLKTRKAKRQPITETALEEMRQEAVKLGWTLERALRESCSRGWASFKADWILKERKNEADRRTDKPSKSERARQAALEGYLSATGGNS